MRQAKRGANRAPRAEIMSEECKFCKLAQLIIP